MSEELDLTMQQMKELAPMLKKSGISKDNMIRMVKTMTPESDHDEAMDIIEKMYRFAYKAKADGIAEFKKENARDAEIMKKSACEPMIPNLESLKKKIKDLEVDPAKSSPTEIAIAKALKESEPELQDPSPITEAERKLADCLHPKREPPVAAVSLSTYIVHCLDCGNPSYVQAQAGLKADTRITFDTYDCHTCRDDEDTDYDNRRNGVIIMVKGYYI